MPEPKTQIKAELIRFLQQEIFDASIRIEDDTDLFDSGFDSFSLVKLLYFIEKRFQIKIPEENLTEESLRNANQLTELLYAFQ